MEIQLADPVVLADPVAAYRAAGSVVRLVAPGMPPMWGLTRYEHVKAMLVDPRFELNSAAYAMRPHVPDDYLPYLRTMQEMDGPEHARLRRLVAPAFTARRAAEFRPRIERVVDALLPAGDADLLTDFAMPLPIEVLCAVVGVPDADRAVWREHGVAVARGYGDAFAAAVPAMIDAAKDVVARRRVEPGDDLVSDLIRVGVADVELVSFVWQLVLAGQVPANLIAPGTAVLAEHPDQVAALRDDPGLLPGAVEELLRWVGPQLLSLPRFAREDVGIDGVVIARGERVTGILAAANRDPDVFVDPERFDVTRNGPAHLSFAHGPHFCLGAGLARVVVQVALGAIVRRFAVVTTPRRLPDPSTWRVDAVRVQRIVA